MKSAIRALGFGFFVIAGAAIAADATDPTVKAREEVMDTIAMNAKILGEMAQGKTPFDAAAAATAKSNLAAAAAEIPAKFKEPATDPASKASPDIWTNWEGFIKHAEDLSKAAEAMDTASAESIGAGMGAVGGVCSDCHKEFRTR